MKGIVSTTNAPAAVGPYSQAVKAGQFLFCSGQIPIDPATGQRADLDPSNWTIWPVVMIPVAVIGFVLATRIWNAKPKGKAASAH